MDESSLEIERDAPVRGGSAVVNTASRLDDVAFGGLVRRLHEDGCYFDCGAFAWRVQADTLGIARSLARSLRKLYGSYPFAAEGPVDVSVRLLPGTGLRRWFHPQVRFVCDGQLPFDPFPCGHVQPLLEWGVNSMFAARDGGRLLLHAGVLERGGRALVLQAAPGSGKSTLTAALMLRGWRLLSDEFGVVDPVSGQLHAMPRPIALKNGSIAAISAWSRHAVLGPCFTHTRQGSIVHLAPDDRSVVQRFTPATPALVICPRYRPGLEHVELAALSPAEVFARFAFNAYNYHRLGAAGFAAALRLAQRCPGFELRYGALEQAAPFIEDFFSASAARHASCAEHV